MARAEAYERLEAQDALRLDETTLDPELHYRFVNPRNMSKRKAQGYEVVLRSESGVRLEGEEEALVKTADDLIHVGQLVLMACKKELYERRRKQNQQLGAQRLSSGESKFQTEARKRGVRSITE